MKVTANDFSPKDASLLNDFFKKVNQNKDSNFDTSLLTKEGNSKLIQLQLDFKTRADQISSLEN